MRTPNAVYANQDFRLTENEILLAENNKQLEYLVAFLLATLFQAHNERRIANKALPNRN